MPLYEDSNRGLPIHVLSTASLTYLLTSGTAPFLQCDIVPASLRGRSLSFSIFDEYTMAFPSSASMTHGGKRSLACP